MSAAPTGRPYILPHDVISPRYRMELRDVLTDGGEERACSYALLFLDRGG